jgi:hypothetical protein
LYFFDSTGAKHFSWNQLPFLGIFLGTPVVKAVPRKRPEHKLDVSVSQSSPCYSIDLRLLLSIFPKFIPPVYSGALVCAVYSRLYSPGFFVCVFAIPPRAISFGSSNSNVVFSQRYRFGVILKETKMAERNKGVRKETSGGDRYHKEPFDADYAEFKEDDLPMKELLAEKSKVSEVVGCVLRLRSAFSSPLHLAALVMRLPFFGAISLKHVNAHSNLRPKWRTGALLEAAQRLRTATNMLLLARFRHKSTYYGPVLKQLIKLKDVCEPQSGSFYLGQQIQKWVTAGYFDPEQLRSVVLPAPAPASAAGTTTLNKDELRDCSLVKEIICDVEDDAAEVDSILSDAAFEAYTRFAAVMNSRVLWKFFYPCPEVPGAQSQRPAEESWAELLNVDRPSEEDDQSRLLPLLVQAFVYSNTKAVLAPDLDMLYDYKGKMDKYPGNVLRMFGNYGAFCRLYDMCNFYYEHVKAMSKDSKACAKLCRIIERIVSYKPASDKDFVKNGCHLFKLTDDEREQDLLERQQLEESLERADSDSESEISTRSTTQKKPTKTPSKSVSTAKPKSKSVSNPKKRGRVAQDDDDDDNVDGAISRSIIESDCSDFDSDYDSTSFVSYDDTDGEHCLSWKSLSQSESSSPFSSASLDDHDDGGAAVDDDSNAESVPAPRTTNRPASSSEDGKREAERERQLKRKQQQQRQQERLEKELDQSVYDMADDEDLTPAFKRTKLAAAAAAAAAPPSPAAPARPLAIIERLVNIKRAVQADKRGALPLKSLQAFEDELANFATQYPDLFAEHIDVVVEVQTVVTEALSARVPALSGPLFSPPRPAVPIVSSVALFPSDEHPVALNQDNDFVGGGGDDDFNAGPIQLDDDDDFDIRPSSSSPKQSPNSANVLHRDDDVDDILHTPIKSPGGGSRRVPRRSPISNPQHQPLTPTTALATKIGEKVGEKVESALHKYMGTPEASSTKKKRKRVVPDADDVDADSDAADQQEHGDKAPKPGAKSTKMITKSAALKRKKKAAAAADAASNEIAEEDKPPVPKRRKVVAVAASKSKPKSSSSSSSKRTKKPSETKGDDDGDDEAFDPVPEFIRVRMEELKQKEELTAVEEQEYNHLRSQRNKFKSNYNWRHKNKETRDETWQFEFTPEELEEVPNADLWRPAKRVSKRSIQKRRRRLEKHMTCQAGTYRKPQQSSNQDIWRRLAFIFTARFIKFTTDASVALFWPEISRLFVEWVRESKPGKKAQEELAEELEDENAQLIEYEPGEESPVKLGHYATQLRDILLNKFGCALTCNLKYRQVYVVGANCTMPAYQRYALDPSLFPWDHGVANTTMLRNGATEIPENKLDPLFYEPLPDDGDGDDGGANAEEQDDDDDDDDAADDIAPGANAQQEQQQPNPIEDGHVEGDEPPVELETAPAAQQQQQPEPDDNDNDILHSSDQE